MIKKVKKGFTLIELVVVIAVIAILSAVSVVAYVGITNNAKKSAANQKAGQAVTTIRAAVLASPSGYEEQETGDKAAVSGKTYVVTIDGKELKIAFKDESALGEGDDIKILKDLLGEVGESDLAKDEIVYSLKTANKESKLGVLIEGKDKTAPEDKDFEWASF